MGMTSNGELTVIPTHLRDSIFSLEGFFQNANRKFTVWNRLSPDLGFSFQESSGNGVFSFFFRLVVNARADIQARVRATRRYGATGSQW